MRSGRVVYVSLNYRLGALGHLDFSRYSTPDRPIESKLGLRDQLVALEWARTNIRFFGGNPHNVTVFGEPAGGNAIITLMATPSARGLPARAIAQSAPSNAAHTSALTDEWAEHFVNVLRAQSLTPAGPIVRRPGAVPASNRAAAPTSPNQLLATATVGALTRPALALQVCRPGANPAPFAWLPVVDGTFLPDHPLHAFRGGRAHRVPLTVAAKARAAQQPFQTDTTRSIVKTAPMPKQKGNQTQAFTEDSVKAMTNRKAERAIRLYPMPSGWAQYRRVDGVMP